ncbi:MAG: hypothetical protein EOO22_22905 [Comamonadaceae bacterium]|nr:MAG: hypothetical protein EOO22_22905 [Comamonadaceae bacterium]
MGGGRRPFILVLAGVNGAGKSSVGGGLLQEHGLEWFNPDSYARALVARLGLDVESANGHAWQYGRDQLQSAIQNGRNFALETTLGANSIPNLLIEAAATHDVVVIYCGLVSPDLHLERVRFRVIHGGHDIPEAKIRERWNTSRLNLIRLLPFVQRLQVFDNSAPADADGNIPDPVLVLEMADGQTLFPDAADLDALASTPAWARPIVQAALH